VLTTLAPTVLLPDGTTVQATNPANAGSETVLRYSLPVPRAPIEVGWQITLPDRAVRRWQFSFPPPPDRATVLYDTLAVGDVTVDRNANAGWMLHVPVTNTGSGPLQLVPADIVLTYNNTAVTVAELPTLTSPLQPQETRTIAIPLPDRREPGVFALSVGPTRLRVEFT
jgi:hypothetical protein